VERRVFWVRGAVQNFRRSKPVLVPLSFRSTWNVPPVVATQTYQDLGEKEPVEEISLSGRSTWNKLAA